MKQTNSSKHDFCAHYAVIADGRIQKSVMGSKKTCSGIKRKEIKSVLCTPNVSYITQRISQVKKAGAAFFADNALQRARRRRLAALFMLFAFLCYPGTAFAAKGD